MSLKFTGERLVTIVDHHLGVTEHLHRYAIALEYCKGKDVLDIASGEGYGTNLISKIAKSVVGVDVSEEAISHAKNKYIGENISFKLGSADKIPLADNSLDIVVSFETLEHHTKHVEMFNEIKRVLRTDGILIMSSPEKSIYFNRDPNNPFHVKELTFSEFKELVSKFFANSNFYFQKYIHGSFIHSVQDLEKKPLQIYNGSYESIQLGLQDNYLFYNRPFFNLVIASDNEVDKLGFSYFDGANVITEQLIEQQKLIKQIMNTKSYRIGNFFISILLRIPGLNKLKGII